jgi:hypothetical protein
VLLEPVVLEGARVGDRGGDLYEATRFIECASLGEVGAGIEEEAGQAVAPLARSTRNSARPVVGNSSRVSSISRSVVSRWKYRTVSSAK